MYGMIHRGLRDLVVQRAGEGAWARLAEQGGISPEHLLTSAPYDDDVTRRILQACCAQLGLDAAGLLEQFGAHWIGFAAEGPYGRLMAMTGPDLHAFVHGLDRLHRSVQAVMPESRLPRFNVLAEQGGRIRLGYVSERVGLEPFVKGLLQGLLVRFGLVGEVAIGPFGPNGREFDIVYAPAPAP